MAQTFNVLLVTGANNTTDTVRAEVCTRGERILGFDLSCGVKQLIIRILGVPDLYIHLNLPSPTPRQSTLQRERLLDRHIDKHIIVGLCLRMNGHLRIQLRGRK